MIELSHYTHALLLIDVTCYKCKRLVALSNAISWDGRNYCREDCLPEECIKIRRELEIS